MLSRCLLPGRYATSVAPAVAARDLEHQMRAARYCLSPDAQRRVLREELREAAHSAAKQQHFYPVGRPGEKWGPAERAEWLARCGAPKRSYHEEVLSKIEPLRARFDVEQYGALSQDPERYPLVVVKSKSPDPSKPWALVTGGVHGYETSGVQGAIRFLETKAEEYADAFNIVVAPCVSPWGYEHIQRWTATAVDPNRSFIVASRQSEEDTEDCGLVDANKSLTEESAALLQMLAEMGGEPILHVDLHETTDTDESEFRPAKASRDGGGYEPDGIPDGFYLVGDSASPEPEFLQAVIDGVKQVTHIAPADEKGCIIGEPEFQEGVIMVPTKKINICGGMTEAQFATTTEVYPDSPKVTDEDCNIAQVASVTSALDFVKQHLAGSAE